MHCKYVMEFRHSASPAFGLKFCQMLFRLLHRRTLRRAHRCPDVPCRALLRTRAHTHVHRVHAEQRRLQTQVRWRKNNALDASKGPALLHSRSFSTISSPPALVAALHKTHAELKNLGGNITETYFPRSSGVD